MKQKRRGRKVPHWHPKYWGVYPLLGVIWLLAQLPYRWRLRVGTGLGWLYYQFAGEAKRIARINLKRCFPQLSSPARENLVKSSFKHVAISAIETTFLLASNHTSLEKMLTKVDGMEHILAAKKQGKGVIVLFPHLSSIFFVGYLFWRLQACEFGCMFREPKHPILAKQFKRQFAGRIQAFTRKNAKAMVAYLSQGGVVWYAPDLLPKRHPHVFAPFLGVETATGIAPMRMAHASGARVLAVQFKRDNEGRFHIRFSEPLTDFPSDNALVDATKVNAAMGEAILGFPEGYLWQYKRFDMPPPGEASPYL